MSATTIADELADDCESAVDAADRLSSDKNNHCDYSKTGLNGVLHKAFAKSESSSTPNSAKSSTYAETFAAKNTQSRVVSREFDSAQQLLNIRYELLQLSVRECIKGVVIERERYLPVNDKPASEKRLKLELYYNCIE